MNKRLAFNGFVLTVAIAIGAGPFMVHAAGRNAEGIVANIDMQRAYADSEMRRTADAKAHEFSVRLYKQYEEVQKLQFLKMDEIQDFSNAATNEKPTDKDTKTIGDIKKTSETRMEEYAKLSSKEQASLTKADKDRISELNKTEQQRPLLLDTLQRLMQDEVNKDAEHQTRLGVAELRLTVNKIAKEQGVQQVFDTSALVVAPIDLTEATVKRVAPKKK